ncbi:MAG: CHAT domain-containing protein [Saprospiraceae bacterium]|jgi:CHAT domain-containing protein/tetratricopeptide (TPR) repeat protein|nr:CHAT domain-containing protein [Saprospiraceae bacterium]
MTIFIPDNGRSFKTIPPLSAFSNFAKFLRILATGFIHLTAFLHISASQLMDSTNLNNTIDSLIQTSSQFTERKEFSKAFESIKAAYHILEQHGDSSSLLYSKVCTYHGRIYFYMGEFSQAENLYLKSNAVLNNGNHRNSKTYLTNIGCLGSLYLNTAKFEQAENFLLESNRLGIMILGEKHPDVSLNLTNLGRLYRLMGMFDKSEHFLLEAIKLREKYIGRNSKSCAFSINSLAILYKDLGNFNKAEKLYLEALKIRESELGKDHEDYMATLLNLAIMYKNLGNYEKSETLYQEALSICTPKKEEEYLNYSSVLGNLGVLKYRMQNFEMAESLYLQTLLVLQNKVTSSDPRVVLCKSNLANVYRATGKYSKAELLYQEIIDLLESSKYTNTTRYANTLHNIGILYNVQGDHSKALIKCREALEIRTSIFGRDHPSCKDSYAALGEIHFHLGNSHTSELYIDSLTQLNKLLYKRAVLHLSEPELNQYINSFHHDQNKLFSLAYFSHRSRPNIVNLCLDNILFYKNLIMRSHSLLQNKLLNDTVNYEKLLLKKALEYRLSLEYLKPIEKRDSIHFINLLNQSNQIDKDLAGNLDFSELILDKTKYVDLKKVLRSNEVAIELVHFNHFFGKTNDSILYAAILLKPGIEHPKFIFLFDQKQLDKLLNRNAECTAQQHLNTIYSGKQNMTINDTKYEENSSLYDLIWKPLINELQGINTVYISKTGLLHQVNLSAISDHNGGIITSKFNINELGSTRNLVRSQPSNFSSRNALLIGGVQFDLDTTDVSNRENLSASAFRNQTSSSINQVPIWNHSSEIHLASSMRRGGKWEYLHWTDKEIESISAIVKSARVNPIKYKGMIATEERIKATVKDGIAPRIIHLATHGYFYPNAPTETPPDGNANIQDSPYSISEHPMIRSGLLLAGSNYAWTTGKPINEGVEDGVLTAYEISQMNLSNTELVVLSACETGLGDIQGNEGVYGLQRAFKIAGAKYLIMSLWQVPDRETKEFMVSFYKNWLNKKKSIPDAFRITQKEMRERFINPYAWAGFVLVE